MEMEMKMSAKELLTLGKESQDLIQAWADPEKTKGFFSESQDLALGLWNAQEKFPALKLHWKEFMAWIAAGAMLESMREYFGDWVDWDVDLFV